MAGRNVVVAAYKAKDAPRQLVIDHANPRARVRKRPHQQYWSEIQDIYRAGSPDAARELVRLSTQAEDERTRTICCGMVMDRAWGKPREYDPDKEAPKKPPPFDPKLYTTEELRRMQEVMMMIAVRQGLVPGTEEVLATSVKTTQVIDEQE